jgi:hypothetical protein
MADQDEVRTHAKNCAKGCRRHTGRLRCQPSQGASRGGHRFIHPICGEYRGRSCRANPALSQASANEGAYIVGWITDIYQGYPPPIW